MLELTSRGYVVREVTSEVLPARIGICVDVVAAHRDRPDPTSASVHREACHARRHARRRGTGLRLAGDKHRDENWLGFAVQWAVSRMTHFERVFVYSG
jgi:hypothetical protein